MKNLQEKFETVSRKSDDSTARFRVILATSILCNIILYICSGQLTFYVLILNCVMSLYEQETFTM